MRMHIDSLELIGYDPETGTFPSTVYSNLSPAPLPYRWTVEGDTVRIEVDHGPLKRPSRARGERTAPFRAAGVPTRARTRA